VSGQLYSALKTHINGRIVAIIDDHCPMAVD